MRIDEEIKSAFFITFSGNCKKALTLYQSCFGGDLHFEYFDKPIDGLIKIPVVKASLVSETITIYGSDLVHDEGRRIGNHLSIFVQCSSYSERLSYIQKLDKRQEQYCLEEHGYLEQYNEQKLIEITDPFGVRWIFSV